MTAPVQPNPWNLTQRECQVLLSLTETGRSKITAADLGIARQTVHTLMRRAMQRMDERVLTMAVLRFDRWARARS